MADISLQQQIIAKLRKLNEAEQRRVLDFIDRTTQQEPVYSARELMRLPPEERERLVAVAFAAAAAEDFELFEAYSEEETDA